MVDGPILMFGMPSTTRRRCRRASPSRWN